MAMNRRVSDADRYRHELKFICPNAELELLERRLVSVMAPDSHANSGGEYVIRSVYFDDYRHSCFYDNEDGVDPRQKFRIRIYNRSAERISLEKKRKQRGMTGKQSCRIDRDTCERMLRGEALTDCLGRHPLLDEWIVLRQRSLYRPVMLGEYVRKPFVYRLGNVRVTFDRNICASTQVTRLFDAQMSRVAVLPQGYHVLEVKYDDYLPDVIRNLVDNRHLRQTTFSKFYLGCKAMGGNTNDFC